MNLKINEFMNEFFRTKKGVQAYVTSHLPIGAGLGSSAAFSASLAAALMIWHGHSEEKALEDLYVREEFTTKVNLWAFRAEKLIHGNPSGIDNCVATYGLLCSSLFPFFFFFFFFLFFLFFSFLFFSFFSCNTNN
jgi:mevalonate kinase